jgi:PAS domain S-box-containing protein
MTTETNQTDQKLRELRIEAEDKLAAVDPESLPGLTSEAKALIHELHVHQIELKMQNENLRQTQAALETAKAHYQELYDFAPIGYLTLNEDGIILQINFTAAKHLGKDRKNIINHRFAKFINNDYKDIWYRHFQLAKQNCEPQGCELPFITGQELISYYHLNFQCKTTENSSLHILITFTDVTERKKHEQALSIAAAAFETQNCIIIADAEKHILRVNQSFCQVTGYGVEEALQLTFPPANAFTLEKHQEISSVLARIFHEY